MANTLKFGNGQWATKDESVLAYNDENNNFKPLPFDFERGSTATRINKEGLIETVGKDIPRIDYLDNAKGALKLERSRTNLITQSQAFGNNYWTKSGASIEGDASTAGVEKVVNGDFATDSDWTKAGLATIGLGAANFVDGGANTYSYIRQNISQEVGKSYQVTFEIKNYVSGGLQLLLEGQGAFGNYSANGTYTVTLNSSTLNGYIEFSRNFSGGTFSFSIDNVSVKEVTGFSAPSVDNPTSAFKLVAIGSPNQCQLYKSVSVTATNTYTFSVLAKKGEENYIALIGLNPFTVSYFDLANGVTLGNTAVSSSIEDYGNGWYRCSIEMIADTSSKLCGIFLSANGTSLSASSITDGNGVYIFGAQLEQGSYPTSLINTQGTVQTRLADTCSQTVPDGVIGQTEGVWYWEGIINNTNTEFQILNSTRSTSNTISLSRQTLNRVRARIWSAGVLNVDIVSTSNVFLNTKSKIAISYKSGNTNVFYNGVLVGSSNNSFSFNGDINEIELSVFVNYFGASLNTNKTNQVLIYKEQLTDSECIALTTL